MEVQCRTLARCATPAAQPVERPLERAAAENAQVPPIQCAATPTSPIWSNKRRADRVRRAVTTNLAGTSECAWSSEHRGRTLQRSGLVALDADALGRGRVDLLILWPQGGRTRRFVLECKVLHKRPGAHHRRGTGADARLHGPLRRRVGPPDRLRPRAGSDVGGADPPPRNVRAKSARWSPSGACDAGGLRRRPRKIRVSWYGTIMTVAAPRLGLRIMTPHDHTDIDVEPLQGLWTQAQYLQLTDHARHLMEFTDGRLEVPQMPTDRHQAISQFLFLVLSPFVRALGGKVRYAPLGLRIRDGKFREPDLLLVRDANDPRLRNDYWRGSRPGHGNRQPRRSRAGHAHEAPRLRGGVHSRILGRESAWTRRSPC